MFIDRGRSVAIIGAGAVGVCCANYLRDAGFDVVIIDPVEPGDPQQCSYGNAGGLSPGSCIPNAMPGILRELPGLLLDPEGPVSLRLLDLPHALPWLLRFLWSSRASRAGEIADAMIELNRLTFEFYQPLVAQAGCKDLIQYRGQLFVYEDPIAPSRATLSTKMRRDRGVRVELLDESQLRELEPSLSPAYKAGLFLPEQGQCVNPGRLIASLWQLAAQKGARQLRTKAKGFAFGQNGPVSILTDDGPVSADFFVVAAGVCSAPLARQLAVHVPLIAERGYHVVLENTDVGLRANTCCAARRFVAAQMEGGLRVTGTAEFAKPSAPPRWERAEMLVRQAKFMFPSLSATSVHRWMGSRPSTPDSIPVIERTPRYSNAILAFGHGHQGLMAASTTGKLVSQLVAGETTRIDLSPYRSSRF
ncbi:FAD-binding oxidoreductase [Bradyrhizobium sp. 180]|uniref:NAD(P)/FAD-dependent oxidoreductase n=1 Tax=Bradyrhizobium sp. 180 TaxID=2782650 RepID=UPI001FFC1E86|nr:FAD-dependent oxidoreductase [Bradyrhizobium sp. 180]MCK1489130.1 FAD-binding oxidoreductase [Bradyrhizobium sp. 180]